MVVSGIWRNISFSQVAVSLFIFGVLLVVAFVEAENVLFRQVLNTVRVTMILSTVAMCLFALPGESDTKTNYWLLFWTSSFASYVVHVYFSFALFFHGSMSEFYAAQGVVVATTNLVITVWWLLDVLLSWFTGSNARWIVVERTAINLLVLFTFFLSTVIFHAVDNKETIVIVLGLLQGLLVLVCWIVRLRAQRQIVSARS